jgi:hypothetical protein
VRNLLSATAPGRALLFPADKLSTDFGLGDADYAWKVFEEGARRLIAQGFHTATDVLEVGPGRNLGTALLWWATCQARASPEDGQVKMVLWDVYPNAANVLSRQSGLAGQLITRMPAGSSLPTTALELLHGVRTGAIVPPLQYIVCSRRELVDVVRERRFGLIYSQAALEHVWSIGDTWELLCTLTSNRGWHYHTIDLADHGRRETDPYEMLEWSDSAYWLMGRFTPGAVNRWRASDHAAQMESMGLQILSLDRQESEVPLGNVRRFAARFQLRDPRDLKTTMIRVVARRRQEAEIGIGGADH